MPVPFKAEDAVRGFPERFFLTASERVRHPEEMVKAG
jgi:hypothetical protein